MQQLPRDYVAQIAPEGYESPGHPHIRRSHYPGLYMQPKHAPRLDFVDLIRLAYAPLRAFTTLYLTTNLQRALALVLFFSIVSTLVSTAVTVDMAEVLGYDTMDALEVAMQGFVNWAVSLLAFMIFGVTAALVAKEVFGGRGEKSSTLTLVGYCYPAYVLVSIILLVVFDIGFEGLDIQNAQDWTTDEVDQALAAGAALLVASVMGIVWLLGVTSRAVSVANDISMGEAALTCILAVLVAGIVYLVVGTVMRLPLGLSF